MKCALTNTRTGEKAVYPTTVEISDDGENYVFKFEAEQTKCYCPFSTEYNKIHSYGDACEILIGNDPERKTYYEIEINPLGGLMLAKMTYCGIGNPQTLAPKLDVAFVSEEDSFVTGEAEITEKGYRATLKVQKDKIRTGDGEVYFNAYRLETDGGEANKHLFALSPTMGNWFHKPDRYVFIQEFVK